MSRLINIAIGVALLAVIASVGVLVFLHFRTVPNSNSALERDREKWQQLVDDDGSNSMARANLGAVYLDMGDTDKAIEQLTIALDQQPDSNTYMNKLGDAYIKAGKFEVAVPLFMNAADKLPASEKYAPYYKAAEADMSAGDTAGAKDFVQKSIADNDIIWNSHFLLGRILEGEGDTAGAKDEYLKAAKYNTNDSDLQAAIDRVST